MTHAHHHRDLDRTLALPDDRPRRRRRVVVQMPNQLRGLGSMEDAQIAFSFKKFGKGIGRGLKKAGKVGFTVAKHASGASLAIAAGKAGYKVGKKGAKLALKVAQYTTPVGWAYTAGKAITKKKRPRAVSAAFGPPGADELEQGGGGGAGGGGDELEEGGGGDELEEGGGEEGGDLDEAEEQIDEADEDAENIEGLDDLDGIFGKIGKAFKAAGKGIGKGAKVVGKGIKVVGKAGVKVAGAVAKQTLANYLGPGAGGGETKALVPQALTVQPGLSLKSPIVIGGAAVVLVGAVLVLGRRKGAPSPQP